MCRETSIIYIRAAAASLIIVLVVACERHLLLQPYLKAMHSVKLGICLQACNAANPQIGFFSSPVAYALPAGEGRTGAAKQARPLRATLRSSACGSAGTQQGLGFRARAPEGGRVEPGGVRQAERQESLQAQQRAAVGALPQRRQHAQRAAQRACQRGLQARGQRRGRRHAPHQQRAHLVARVQRAPARSPASVLYSRHGLHVLLLLACSSNTCSSFDFIYVHGKR